MASKVSEEYLMLTVLSRCYTTSAETNQSPLSSVLASAKSMKDPAK